MEPEGCMPEKITDLPVKPDATGTDLPYWTATKPALILPSGS